MFNIKYRILLVSAASLFALAACNSKDSPEGAAPSKDAVAATVNGTPISERLVDSILKQQGEHGQQASADARNEFIDRLATQVVISQEAVKKGLDKDPEVLDRIDLGRRSALVEAFVRDYYKQNPVSEDALKAEYEKFKAEMAGTEYKASHILVKTEGEAKDIIAKLKKDPKAFAALAKEKSQDPGSKNNGGDLGWFDPRRMVPEFSAAAAALAKGNMSQEPVKSSFGYHVILLEDSRAREVPTLEEVKPPLTQRIQQQNLKKLVDEMKAKAKIEIVKAPASAPAAPQEAKPAEAAKAAEPAKPEEAAKPAEPAK